MRSRNSLPGRRDRSKAVNTVVLTERQLKRRKDKAKNIKSAKAIGRNVHRGTKLKHQFAGYET